MDSSTWPKAKRIYSARCSLCLEKPGNRSFYLNVVGGRETKQHIHMNNNHNNNSFHQKQREMFARLLTDAKKQAQAELESQSLDDQVKSELLPKLAEERGASPLIAKLRNLRKEVEDAEETLEKLGFSCDEDSISLKWEAPKDLKKAVDAAKRALEKERETELRKYDLGIVAVWATEDIQKVREIVEGLL